MALHLPSLASVRTIVADLEKAAVVAEDVAVVIPGPQGAVVKAALATAVTVLKELETGLSAI